MIPGASRSTAVPFSGISAHADYAHHHQAVEPGDSNQLAPPPSNLTVETIQTVIQDRLFTFRKEFACQGRQKNICLLLPDGKGNTFSVYLTVDSPVDLQCRLSASYTEREAQHAVAQRTLRQAALQSTEQQRGLPPQNQSSLFTNSAAPCSGLTGPPSITARSTPATTCPTQATNPPSSHGDSMMNPGLGSKQLQQPRLLINVDPLSPPARTSKYTVGASEQSPQIHIGHHATSRSPTHREPATTTSSTTERSHAPSSRLPELFSQLSSPPGPSRSTGPSSLSTSHQVTTAINPPPLQWVLCSFPAPSPSVRPAVHMTDRAPQETAMLQPGTAPPPAAYKRCTTNDSRFVQDEV